MLLISFLFFLDLQNALFLSLVNFFPLAHQAAQRTTTTVVLANVFLTALASGVRLEDGFHPVVHRHPPHQPQLQCLLEYQAAQQLTMTAALAAAFLTAPANGALEVRHQPQVHLVHYRLQLVQYLPERLAALPTTGTVAPACVCLAAPVSGVVAFLLLKQTARMVAHCASRWLVPSLQNANLQYSFTCM